MSTCAPKTKRKGGYRPGSGQKPKAINAQVSQIADRELPGIILKSAKAVNDFFDSIEFTAREKAELGAKFLVKAMPQRFEGEVRPILVSMGTIKVKQNGKTQVLKFDIGA